KGRLPRRARRRRVHHRRAGRGPRRPLRVSGYSARLMPFPTERPRRLRPTAALRRLVRETRLRPDRLLHPAFVRESAEDPVPIATMRGQFQETHDSLLRSVQDAMRVGISACILFGIPAEKDAEGSQAWAEHGVVQTAIRRLKHEFGDELVVIADCSLDEYTDHGHCGVLM